MVLKVVEAMPMVAIGIVAFIHAVLPYKEIFDWEVSAVKVIGMTPDDARDSAGVGRNQGLSNGFLAAGAAWALAEWWLRGPAVRAASPDVLRRLRLARGPLRVRHVPEARVPDQAGVARGCGSRGGSPPDVFIFVTPPIVNGSPEPQSGEGVSQVPLRHVRSGRCSSMPASVQPRSIARCVSARGRYTPASP